MSSIYEALLGCYLMTRLRKACATGCSIVIVLWLVAAPALADSPKTTPPWAPPDIDRVFPPVNTDAPCALGGVLKGASRRVQDLVVNMQRFSATEQVVFDEFDRQGGLRGSKKATFSYVAYIHEVAAQQLAVEEYRNDDVALQDFPSRVATLGTAAFALIFHPNYLKDFSVTCEGMSEWQGRRAWRLHLSQVNANNFRGYRLANRYFRVMLKARAWIDAETFEVLRLETDLRDPIAEIPLLLEHVTVEYAMVDFPRRNLKLWLPREAEIYMDYRGKQYHHRHSFSHFQLFWVDTEQTVKGPQIPPSEPSNLPANIGTKTVIEFPAPVETPVSQPGDAIASPAFQPAAAGGAGSAEQHAAPWPAPRSAFVPATPAEATTTVQPQPAPKTDSLPAKLVSQPATQQVTALEPPAPAIHAAAAESALPPPSTRATAGTQQPAPFPNTAAKPVSEPPVTPPSSLKERPEPAADAAKTRSAPEPARLLVECSECLRVLISQRDDSGTLRDNWRTQAQDDWIRRNAEHLIEGKGAKIRFIPARPDADYNIVWNVGFIPGTTYRTMRAEVVVFEIESGKKLFYTSHESRYWDVDHPENKCLQDAINFLKNKARGSHGYGLAFR